MWPDHVAALELASVHGMAHAEIGAILRKAPRRVKPLMFRARRAFEREWASLEVSERVQTV